MPEPTYNEEERAVLRQAREMEETISSKGWKAFTEILDAQIALREQLLFTPVTQLPADQFSGMDFASRAAALEGIKGALIGLRLARDLPTRTIEQAKSIRADHKED